MFNHRYPFVRLHEFFLSVCRKLIFSNTGYLSIMLYNFFLSFSRNFSFVQLQEYFCKLKGVLSGFVQTTITICFAFILFLFFFENKNMKLVKLQHLHHDIECIFSIAINFASYFCLYLSYYHFSRLKFIRNMH